MSKLKLGIDGGRLLLVPGEFLLLEPESSDSSSESGGSSGGSTGSSGDDSSASSMSCEAFEYHPRGRKGIGVDQPQGGTNYPLVAPSDDIRYLLADLHVTHEADAVLPLRI